MPAEGGYAHQRTRVNRARGGRSTAYGVGHSRGGNRQISQGGFNVTTKTGLRSRAHQPGRDPGSYDPRMGAASQQWGTATRSQRGWQGFTQPRTRWWEQSDVIGRPTDVTWSQGGPGAQDFDPDNWQRRMMGEDFADFQRGRWGQGYFNTFQMQGMNPFDAGMISQEGGATGANLF